MAEQSIEVRMSVVWTNERAADALNVLVNTLNEISDDFSYRDDVKRALRAARYLARHVGVHSSTEPLVKYLEGE